MQRAPIRVDFHVLFSVKQWIGSCTSCVAVPIFLSQWPMSKLDVVTIPVTFIRHVSQSKIQIKYVIACGVFSVDVSVLSKIKKILIEGELDRDLL